MNKLPTDLINHVYSFSNTQDLIKSLLINKYQHLVIFDTLNKRWPVDLMRIKLIFKLWYKKFRPVRRHRSNTRSYSNSWTRPIYDPSDRIILLR